MPIYVSSLFEVNDNILKGIYDAIQSFTGSVQDFIDMTSDTYQAVTAFRTWFINFMNNFGMWTSLASAITTAVLLSILFIGVDIIRDLL